jgi:hypothetical protein
MIPSLKFALSGGRGAIILGLSVVRKSARVNPAQPLKEFIEGASIECPASPAWCGSTNNGHSLRSYFPPR